MGKTKLLSVSMAVVMLMTMLVSCSSDKKKDNIVKEDDPWYESTRFKITMDLKSIDDLGDCAVCAGNDCVYSVYCSIGLGKITIDKYDFGGNLVKRQEATCSEISNFRAGRIYSLSVDPDGKNINAIIHITAPNNIFAAFVNIDAETGIVSDIKEVYGKEASKARKPDSGTLFINAIGDYAIAVLDYSYDAQFAYQLLLFKDKDFVAELDLSTVNLRDLLDGFSINESTNSIYAAGYENADIITLEFDTGTGKLKSKKAFQNSDIDKINFGEYSATDKGDLCKIDSLGNVMKVDVNTMTARTVIETNWYTPDLFSDFSDLHSDYTKILSCDEDRTIILESESRYYGIQGYNYGQHITVLTKSDKNPHAGKEVIELALSPNSTVSEYLARSIYEFNKSDNEYLIRIWGKYDSGFTLGRVLGKPNEDEQKIYEMIQDLKGDDAPDLAIGIQKNYAMRDDVFMDLTGFLDPEIMDKQYGNIFEAAKIDGKQYFFPVSLMIEGLVTNKDLIADDAIGISFEDYDKLVKEKMDGFSPYDYPFSTVYNKRSFVLSCIDIKSAIEGKQIEFGTEQFRAAAEYAKDNFEYDDENSIPDEYITDYGRNRGECYYAKLGNYLDFVHACYTSSGQYKIIGTPSVDECGPRFIALETISVSATTDVEKGCRKFLNYLFSGAAYDSDDCEFGQIVTNKEIMQRNIETLTRENNKAYDSLVAAKASGAVKMTEGTEKANGDKAATDDMRESFLNSMSSISVYYYEDHEIVQFLSEEIAPYYAGDRSIDDVIKYMNDRTAKYVREM